jgi:carbon-monoxide dehydrogenase medium subunit
MTGVFVAKHGDGSVRVAVTGAGSDGVFRHEGMEQALASDFSAGCD